jgi:hypothetical protein
MRTRLIQMAFQRLHGWHRLARPLALVVFVPAAAVLSLVSRFPVPVRSLTALYVHEELIR